MPEITICTLQGTRAEPSILDDGIATEQPLAEPIDGGLQSRPLEGAPRRIDTQKHEARNRLGLAEDEVTEILVFSQQQPVLAVSTVHNLGVSRPRCDIRHVRYIMAGLA